MRDFFWFTDATSQEPAKNTKFSMICNWYVKCLLTGGVDDWIGEQAEFGVELG